MTNTTDRIGWMTLEGQELAAWLRPGSFIQDKGGVFHTLYFKDGTKWYTSLEVAIEADTLFMLGLDYKPWHTVADAIADMEHIDLAYIWQQADPTTDIALLDMFADTHNAGAKALAELLVQGIYEMDGANASLRMMMRARLAEMFLNKQPNAHAKA